MAFHISGDGVPRKCNAKTGNCPLGGEHYETKVEAEQAFEQNMEAQGWAKVTKRKPTLAQKRKELQKANDAVAVNKKELRAANAELLEAAKNEDFEAIKKSNKQIAAIDSTLASNVSEARRLKAEVTARARRNTATATIKNPLFSSGGCGSSSGGC